MVSIDGVGALTMNTNDKNLAYREVMAQAVARKLTMTAEQQNAMRFKRMVGMEGEELYIMDGGAHVVDATYGNLVTLNDGAVIITGAPTTSAAMTAARCALLMGLAA